MKAFLPLQMNTVFQEVERKRTFPCFPENELAETLGGPSVFRGKRFPFPPPVLSCPSCSEPHSRQASQRTPSDLPAQGVAGNACAFLTSPEGSPAGDGPFPNLGPRFSQKRTRQKQQHRPGARETRFPCSPRTARSPDPIYRGGETPHVLGKGGRGKPKVSQFTDSVCLPPGSPRK